MNRARRILLLHTDEQVLMTLERALEDMGIETTTTWDMAEALRLARSRHFELLLVGEHPPEISASELLRELQCSRASVACVVLQSSHERFEADYFYSLGAAGVIDDPEPANVCEWINDRLDAAAVAATG